MQAMSGLAMLAAFVLAAFVLAGWTALGWLGAREVEARLRESGRQVLHLRRKWLHRVGERGISPLAIVYRVTAASEGQGSKSSVRLYAFDPGQWLSRTNELVRLYSGGVWRNL